jgi:ankyrin repeat protein
LRCRHQRSSGEYGNALQAAVTNGHEALVRLLIDRGADINAHGGKYGNALQAAAYTGHETLFRVLIDHDADFNAQGGEFGSALQAAHFKQRLATATRPWSVC